MKNTRGGIINGLLKKMTAFLEQITAQYEAKIEELEYRILGNNSETLKKELRNFLSNTSAIDSFQNSMRGVKTDQLDGQEHRVNLFDDFVMQRKIELDNKIKVFEQGLVEKGKEKSEGLYSVRMGSEDHRFQITETYSEGQNIETAFEEKGWVLQEDGTSKMLPINWESDIKMPGKKVQMETGKEVKDERLDTRAKYSGNLDKIIREDTMPLLNKYGEVIGTRKVIKEEDRKTGQTIERYIETYDGEPGKDPTTIETEIVMNGGIESARVKENGKTIELLKREKNGEIKIKALDKDTDRFVETEIDDVSGITYRAEAGGKNKIAIDLGVGVYNHDDFDKDTGILINPFDWILENEGIDGNFGISQEVAEKATSVDPKMTEEHFVKNLLEYSHRKNTLEYAEKESQKNSTRESLPRENDDDEER